MPQKNNSRGENHINLTENTKINKFQSESMEIDKYSKPGPKIDEGQRNIVNGNLGQKIHRCRKKKSRGESHINLTGNAKINEFQSESREIDKSSKPGPKIDEGQRRIVNDSPGQKIYRCRKKTVGEKIT